MRGAVILASSLEGLHPILSMISTWAIYHLLLSWRFLSTSSNSTPTAPSKDQNSLTTWELCASSNYLQISKTRLLQPRYWSFCWVTQRFQVRGHTPNKGERNAQQWKTSFLHFHCNSRHCELPLCGYAKTQFNLLRSQLRTITTMTTTATSMVFVVCSQLLGSCSLLLLFRFASQLRSTLLPFLCQA